jgi:hypothetical protein
MSDQANLPGQSPEQLRVLEAKAKLSAMARDLAAIDINALANAAESGSWEEELAVAFLDCRRRLRQCGVMAQLAQAAFMEGQRDA